MKIRSVSMAVVAAGLFGLAGCEEKKPTPPVTPPPAPTSVPTTPPAPPTGATAPTAAPTGH